jgi:hypothetical protein
MVAGADKLDGDDDNYDDDENSDDDDEKQDPEDAVYADSQGGGAENTGETAENSGAEKTAENTGKKAAGAGNSADHSVGAEQASRVERTSKQTQASKPANQQAVVPQIPPEAVMVKPPASVGQAAITAQAAMQNTQTALLH